MSTMQAIKRHGGKAYLAQKIVELMPPRCKNPNAPKADDPGYIHYVEPFFGGGSVLMANDPEGISEVVNDLSQELINFWRVLARPTAFEQFKRMVEATPCSEWHYDIASDEARSMYSTDFGPDATKAWAFFVRNRQSRQALGKDFSTLARTRTRRGMNELPSAWLTAIEGLPEIHARLQRVVIRCGDAVPLIRQQDGPRTLFYLDPPYVHSSRVTNGEYEHEMSDGDHAELLQVLSGIKGKFILSGYHSALYDEAAARNIWRLVEFSIDNKASNQKVKPKKIECVWMNYH